jgi:predicted esterase
VSGHQNIVLAGISQGCAVAIHALLKQESKLCGFIGLSSWIPTKASLSRTTKNAQCTPVFLSHSKNDKVIKIKYGEELRDSLKEIGMEVEWHAYKDGGHWVNEPSGVGEYYVLRSLCQVTEANILTLV